MYVSLMKNIGRGVTLCLKLLGCRGQISSDGREWDYGYIDLGSIPAYVYILAILLFLIHNFITSQSNE